MQLKASEMCGKISQCNLKLNVAKVKLKAKRCREVIKSSADKKVAKS